MSIDAKNYTMEQRRALLDSAGGRFFHVKFTKKDGTLRDMTCKKWVRAYLHGEPGQNDNTVAHIPKYYTVAEPEEKSYKNINLETLVKVSINGQEYEF